MKKALALLSGDKATSVFGACAMVFGIAAVYTDEPKLKEKFNATAIIFAGGTGIAAKDAINKK